MKVLLIIPLIIGRKKLEESSKADAVAKFTAKCANGKFVKETERIETSCTSEL